MYGPPPSESSDDDDLEGFAYGGDYDAEGNRIKRKKTTLYQHRYVRKEDEINEKLQSHAQNGDVIAFRQTVEENRDIIKINQPLCIGWTPLMIACREKHTELVKYLVTELNANVNKSVDYYTPLIVACSGCRDDSVGMEANVLEILKILMERNAGVNVRNRNGQTPLMFAVENGYKAVVKLLLDHKVSVDAIDNEDRTALFYAVDKNQLEITKMLMDAGATVDVVDRQGDTPKLLAQHRDFKDIENLFPADEEVKLVPFKCLSYNSYKELIPTAFPDLDVPAYAPDVFILLNGMRSENLEYTIYESQIGLPDLLSVTDRRLEQIGIKFPYQRKRIMFGLVKFNLHKFTKDALHLPRHQEPTSITTYFDIFSSCLKHLIILKHTQMFVQRSDLFGENRKLTAKSRNYCKQIDDLLIAIERRSCELLRNMENMQKHTAVPIPLFIDENAIQAIMKKGPNQLIPFQQIKKALLVGVGVGVAFVFIKLQTIFC